MNASAETLRASHTGLVEGGCTAACTSAALSETVDGPAVACYFCRFYRFAGHSIAERDQPVSPGGLDRIEFLHEGHDFHLQQHGERCEANSLNLEQKQF